MLCGLNEPTGDNMNVVEKFVYNLINTPHAFNVGDTVYFIETVFQFSSPVVCSCGYKHNCKAAHSPQIKIHKDTISDIMVVGVRVVDNLISICNGGPSITYELSSGYYAKDKDLFRTQQEAENNTDSSRFLIR